MERAGRDDFPGSGSHPCVRSNEVFSTGNASTLESFAATNGVGELSFWEVDGYDKPAGYAYSKIFNTITGGNSASGGGSGGGSGGSGGPGGSTSTPATQAQIWSCTSGANQSWKLP